MGQICHPFLHLFSVYLDVILKMLFCRSFLCYVSKRCVKTFYGSKRIKGICKLRNGKKTKRNEKKKKRKENSEKSNEKKRKKNETQKTKTK